MPRQTTYDRVEVLGVDIDVLSLTEAINYILERATPGQPAGYVVKPYVEFLDKSYRNPKLQDLLNHADLALADGIALLWSAHFLYAGPRTATRFVRTLTQIVTNPKELLWPLPARAAGTTFTWPLLQAAAEHGLRVYLVGTPQHGTILHTASILKNAIPGLVICGTHTGTDPQALQQQQSAGWLQALGEDITQSKADIVLIGVGFPRQDYACQFLAQSLGHGMFIGEGGTFDYELFGGKRPKAPAAMQKFGLEWLWRLALEPRRIIRQLAIPRFIYRVWRNRR